MLRPIQPITCKQFISHGSPAIVYTVVQLCFTPPFKYVVIIHGIDNVISISHALSKQEVEKNYNLQL